MNKREVKKMLNESVEELRQKLYDYEYYEDFDSSIFVAVYQGGAIGVETYGPGVSREPCLKYLEINTYDGLGEEEQEDEETHNIRVNQLIENSETESIESVMDYIKNGED